MRIRRRAQGGAVEHAGPVPGPLRTDQHHRIAFGRQGVSAERVGHELLRDVQAYLSLEAPVGPYLADQLLLPMALGAGGRFITGLPTEHTLTHRDIINRFLGPVVTIEAMDKRLWQVEVKAGGAG